MHRVQQQEISPRPARLRKRTLRAPTPQRVAKAPVAARDQARQEHRATETLLASRAVRQPVGTMERTIPKPAIHPQVELMEILTARKGILRQAAGTAMTTTRQVILPVAELMETMVPTEESATRQVEAPMTVAPLTETTMLMDTTAVLLIQVQVVIIRTGAREIQAGTDLGREAITAQTEARPGTL
jgi:hypothetical protein